MSYYPPPPSGDKDQEEKRSNRTKTLIGIGGILATLVAALIGRTVVVQVQNANANGPNPGGGTPITQVEPATPTPPTGIYLMNLQAAGTIPHRGLATIPGQNGASDSYPNSIWWTPDQEDGFNQVHATYMLGGTYKTLDAWLGAQQSSAGGYSDTYEIWLDGIRVAKQDAGPTSQPYHLIVSVAGARQLLITITFGQSFYDVPTMGDAILFALAK